MTNTKQREQLAVTSPFNGDVINTIPMQNLDDANAMLASANALFRNKTAWLAHHERAAILKKLASLVEDEVNSSRYSLRKKAASRLWMHVLKWHVR